MAGFNDFSTTAASNASVGAITFAEGQLPSTVNNSMREVMKDLADVRDGNVVADGWHVNADGLTLHDQSDSTKKVIFDVSGQSAGTTKTIAMPTTGGTLALTSDITTDAPADASYVVMGSNGNLSAERVLTAGTGITLTNSSTAGTVTVAAASGILQIITGSIVADSTTLTTPARDNTTPLVSEGKEVFSQAITVSSGSKVKIEVDLVIAHANTSEDPVFALFRGNTCIKVINPRIDGSGTIGSHLAIMHVDTHGTSGSVTYSLRAGAGSSGTVYWGQHPSALFNGLLANQSYAFTEVL